MRKLLKWVGLGIGGVLGLALILVGILYVRGGMLLTADIAMSDEVTAQDDGLRMTSAVATAAQDAKAVAWGQHLTRSHACTECHRADLSGQVLADDPPFRAVASNLTGGAGGIGRTYTDRDWEQAIRHGVRPDRRALLVMPSDSYAALSDDEMHALIAYLKTVPPVDNVLPETVVRSLGRILLGTGAPLTITSKIDQTRPHQAVAPPIEATVAFGAYRAATICTVCHGQKMEGAPHPEPGAPWSPSMRAAQAWSEAEFITALRTGVKPSGAVLNEKYMPWPYVGQMTDTELRALYRYIQTLSFEEATESVASR